MAALVAGCAQQSSVERPTPSHVRVMQGGRAALGQGKGARDK